MRRLLTASALFALALAAATATGQPQPDPKAKAPEKAPAPKGDSADAAIAAALANDPDVKMARAKIQLAEAELAKARQVVTLRVVVLKGKIEQLKAEVGTAETRFAAAARLFQQGVVPKEEQSEPRDKLLAAKSALETAETEWRLLTGGANTGGAPLATADPWNDGALPLALWSLADKNGADQRQLALKAYWQALQVHGAVKGPVPDRLRALLDKPMKLGPKGAEVTFAQAIEAFKKEAGWDVPIRGEYPTARRVLDKNGGPILDDHRRPLRERIQVVSEGEELPVGAWLQMFEDFAVLPGPGGVERYRFYVREYGILVTPTAAAPPDAPTLTEFWKQKPAAKDPKK